MLNKNCFYKIGERTNVFGSIKFKKLIIAKKYKDALKQQVINGANIIDYKYGWYFNKFGRRITKIYKVIKLFARITQIAINDRFISLKNILAGMKNIQGKCIINSNLLKMETNYFQLSTNNRMYGCIPVTVVWMKQDKQHLRTQIDNLQKSSFYFN